MNEQIAQVLQTAFHINRETPSKMINKYIKSYVNAEEVFSISLQLLTKFYVCGSSESADNAFKKKLLAINTNLSI